MTHEVNPLRAASELALQGRTMEAIACLESALAQTRSEKERPGNVSLLARTAGLHCEHAGLLSRAALYYEEARAAAGSDPLPLLALADVRWRLGQAEVARSCLAEAESMLQSAPNTSVSAMIGKIRMKWASNST